MNSTCLNTSFRDFCTDLHLPFQVISSLPPIHTHQRLQPYLTICGYLDLSESFRLPCLCLCTSLCWKSLSHNAHLWCYYPPFPRSYCTLLLPRHSSGKSALCHACSREPFLVLAKRQANSYLRTFVLATPATWNTYPSPSSTPDIYNGLPPHLS